MENKDLNQIFQTDKKMRKIVISKRFNLILKYLIVIIIILQRELRLTLNQIFIDFGNRLAP